ncbi:hypothetical protein ABB55_14890 [Prosthecomicrobium hirschii]|uniref:Glycine transporter domain-containing protein n=1 Tax=Prosthecodimorpha hirschii TaxID=665126 RepID=A0A0P6VKZ4_9HYPH|nr:trimeric intracellular cation channel family protein [Prosthecomicrobium hirschii]KPL53342.1 hypothetical protein ABB55_14890 [Prosthecomicrobium hirschii]
MIATFAAILDWAGLVVFAVTGALVASRKQMDIVGFALLATVTGIGGGTLRDLVLGLAPVFWVRQPAYLLVCVGVAAAVFFTAHLPQSRYRILLWLDAVGMAVFAVTGAEIALAARAGPVIAVAMGVATATFGGIIRDVLGGEVPVILSREIYATAALCGASLYVVCDALGTAPPVAAVLGFAVAFLLRAAAMARGWSLPRYRPRRGRTPEEVETLRRRSGATLP